MRKLFLPLLALFACLFLAVGPLAGAGLSRKYKTWDKSPEAYFLTNAERARWKQVGTDADAQSFILDYKAKRGADFDKMLGEREAVADKYFSSGETKGSETLRGKVVILFGPPASIEKDAGSTWKGRADPSAIQAVANSNSRDSQPTISSAGTASPTSPHAAAVQTPLFTFVYDTEHAPKAIGKPFRAELKMYSAVDQEPADPRDLEAKFETVAEASVVTAEASSSRKP